METETTARFKPTRAGIINLWDYVNEVFLFADGRLVLRGHNGAGKTKALEVLFPFVLDGRTDPRRLDPFSGENRTMKENLLYRGNEAGYGYVWMELARPAHTGERPECVTIGIGMHARKHKDGVTTWFFVADGAVGRDFELVVEERPLTHAGLIEVLGADRVRERARDYRDLVDARLFGLGTERYAQMLDLVLTLRKPQLSKDLDPDTLSAVLSRGLRPLDDDLLVQVAKSFDDLEIAQRELERLVAADDTLQSFLTLYRGHIRAVARHRVDLARTAADLVGRRHRELDEARVALGEAKQEEADVAAALQITREELDAARTRKEALLQSPVYQAVTQLENIEAHLATAEDTASKGEAALRRLRENLGDLDAKVATAARELADALRDRATTDARVLRAARACNVEWNTLDANETVEAVDTRLSARIGSRRADVTAVRGHMERLAEAERRAADAEEALQDARTKLAAADAHLEAAEVAASAAREALATNVRGWAQSRPDAILDPEDLVAILAAIATTGESGAPTLREVLIERFAERRDRASREQADLERQIGELDALDAGLAARCEAILDERDDAPAVSQSRPASREARPGAPLWRLVRFRDELDRGVQAGIEAALEAAGILDAWVMPSEEHSCAGVLDGFLVAQRAVDGDGTLAEVLVPEDQPDVAMERIDALLKSIAFPLDAKDAVAFIAPDGTYRVGPLTGAYHAEGARFIGATARAAHRQARVGDLDRQRAELATGRSNIVADLERVVARQAAYDDASFELPPSVFVLEALRAIDTERGAANAARDREQTANETLNRWKRDGNDRRNTLRREAAARSLPMDAGGMAAVVSSLDQMELLGGALLADVRRSKERERSESAWRSEFEKRSSELATAETNHELQVKTRDRLSIELFTLRANVGADADALRSELADVATRMRTLEREEGTQQRQTTAAVEARTRADDTVLSAQTSLGEAVAANRAAMLLLLPVSDAELGSLLEIDPATATAAALQDDPMSPETAALLAALDAKTRGSSGSEDRRKTALAQVTTQLSLLAAQLGAYYRAEWTYDGEIIRVTIADDEGANSVAAFAQKLAARRREQEALLTVREREVFEDALLSALCRQLHARTTAARDLVRHMDRAMRERKMSSGKTVGISWTLDDDLSPEQRRAVRSLEFDPANLAPDQLDDLRSHFSREVKSARMAQPSRSYRDILSTVLDYRAWRRFVLHLADSNGHEETLTKVRHSKLSGGEKAASLHLPLFAAAHAQFSSARATCPRLVALDEAFAGIDSHGKPELMSLSVEFDLDLFMTGYDLWVTFPGVPMAAHYDLVHVASENTVSAMLLLWDGAELVEGERAEALISSAAGR